MLFAPQYLPPTGRGTRSRPVSPVRVVVIGGGLAGAAAAMILAERGVAVTLLERERYLGGRAGAWEDRLADGSSFEMERGFHAFFRHYYNLRALMRRSDPRLRCLTGLDDYPLLGPEGAAESFAELPRQLPFNVIALVRRTPRLRLDDLLHVNARAALAMAAYDSDWTFGRYDDLTAKNYLDSLGFPPDARQMLFDVFTHSSFNPEERYSAAHLLMMFHAYFLGNPEGLLFDVLAEPFSLALWRPLARVLEHREVRLLTGVTATRVGRSGSKRWVVDTARGDLLEADAVVLAVELPALQTLVAASPDLADEAWRERVGNLQAAPAFAVWRMWLDRPAAPERPPFAGTTGLGLLDNVSLYEQLEGESRRWALRTGGSIVELHAYALSPRLDDEAIKADLRLQLARVYPELRGAQLLEERYLLRRDCPAFLPGQRGHGLTVATPFDGLALAGDFVELPFPAALMEAAVSSGMLAANHLMDAWELQPEPIVTVPRKGLLTPIAGLL